MAPTKLSSKRRRKARTAETSEGTNKIGSLPDSVLCHILSFLPTRTAVATMSLVSRRWLNLWKHLQAFDFQCVYIQKDLEKFKRFSFFVNTVLVLRRSCDIRKFRLHLCGQSENNFVGDCVEMWIRAAAGTHLEQLCLTIDGADVKLPPSFFMNCNNLVSLSLVGDFNMDLQHSSLHFPSLKYLCLDLELVDSQVAFLFGCPKLETLEISLYYTSLTKVSIPPSSIIESLKSTDSFTWTYFDFGIDKYEDEDIKLGVVGSFHSMVEAFLDTFSSCECESADPILKLIRDIKSDNGSYDDYFHLLVCHSTSKWPLQAPLLNYSELCNLIHLKFLLPHFHSNLVLDMLEKCHMIKVLIIKSSKEESSLLRTWELRSTTVPKCLTSYLTHVHIEGYQGFEDELAFAEYILQNGLVLETMLIFVDTSVDITNKYRSLKRLTDIPKGSLKCRLKFDASASS